MTAVAWRPFLERLSREVLADRDQRAPLPPEVITSGWLGFPPATANEVETLEKRLGTNLPDSYRSFLLTSNGWRTAGAFVYDLLPAAKVTWFRDSHKDWQRPQAASDLGGFRQGFHGLEALPHAAAETAGMSLVPK